MSSHFRRAGFTLMEIMLAVFIVGVGVIPVINLYLTGSRTVERGGEVLRAAIAGQDIIDRAKSDAFLWDHIPLAVKIPDPNFPDFTIPKNFAAKYQATATLMIDKAPGHTVLGTGFNEENLVQIAVTVYWQENGRQRSTRLVTYRANVNSFSMKTSTRF
jgi:prepilin-type N-terminal cleavage/methylation domain-containing protein